MGEVPIKQKQKQRPRAWVIKTFIGVKPPPNYVDASDICPLDHYEYLWRGYHNCPVCNHELRSRY